jgi:hypothetical protein
MSDDYCECTPCRYAREFSDVPVIDDFVRALVAKFDVNPLDRTGHSATRAGIRDIIKTGFGKREADRLRFVVH